MMNVFHAAGSTFKNRSIAGLMIDAKTQSGPLSDDQIKLLAPSAFAEGRHESRTERYTYIPTIQVIQALRSEGFLPVAASQGKCRLPGKTEFTKHLIRFRREMDMVDARGGVAETVLINSHDGTSSYWMLEGMFRGACKNGLIVAEGDTQGIKVSHSGKIIDKVVAGSYAVIDNATRAVETAKTWARIELAAPERLAFANAALALRFDAQTQHVDARDVIAIRREADESNDLWTVFNRAQESLIRGGMSYTHRNANNQARHLTARPVNSIDKNVGLNQALWTLGAEMAKLKGVAA
jgi:hypothetical protein